MTKKLKELIEKNKKASLVSLAGVLVIISIIVYGNSIAYAVNIDGKVIGIVKNKNEVINIQKEIQDTYKQELHKDIKLSQEITFEKVYKFGKKLKTPVEIKQVLENNLDVNVDGYAIVADDKEIVIVDNKESADNILTELKNQYVDEENTEANENSDKETEEAPVKEVSLLEKVEVIKKYVNTDLITSADEALQLITVGTDEIEEYEIKKGDVVSVIAENYNIKTTDIKKANPEMNIDKIQIGQIISLTVPKPFINVKTVEEAKYVEKISYETEYQESSNVYKGETKIQVKGVNGSKNVEAEIVKINGIENERVILQEEIIQEPVTQVVLKGTKERPKTLAYGSFKRPSSGYITSKFGRRWGRMHNGVDFGVPTGTPNKAADGGKVIYSGWKGGYGYLVIIDHENGYKTYYGHNSILKVKVGERVYRGQTIALSGNTGNSTGPHLHFEIRKNGSPVNPLKYI
ncbi:peptidoglycan DD-metalloendopeptidase family protein [Clostridium sediminicola]|uniref:peptidoglycan DD-metalloendopeptidase family protein n=1 Tax=Clostridium sediminicola TaxID=3114879 RepID=UPI0031F1F4C9